MLWEDLPWVYGAALNASSSEECAAEAARSAVEEAPATSDRRLVMAWAVTGALDSCPAESLARLTPPEREAIGLARIMGMNVDEIAAFTGRTVLDVKASMCSGLARLSGRLPAAGAV